VQVEHHARKDPTHGVPAAKQQQHAQAAVPVESKIKQNGAKSILNLNKKATEFSLLQQTQTARRVLLDARPALPTDRNQQLEELHIPVSKVECDVHQPLLPGLSTKPNSWGVRSDLR
jgi:hypothetical protein